MVEDRAPRVRGKSYDMEKIMQLYKQGMSYKEIASKMNIRSLQSLRHSVEREIKREIDDLISDMQEEKRIALESGEGMMKEKLELEKRLRPPLTGLLDIYADQSVLRALMKAAENLDIPYSSSVDSWNFYFPELSGGEMKAADGGLYWKFVNQYGLYSSNGKISIDHLRRFLFGLGFYLTLESGDPQGERVAIYVAHGHPGSSVSPDLVLNGYFRIIQGNLITELRNSLSNWIALGYLKFHGVSNIELLQQDELLDQIRDHLRKRKFYLSLHHDPSTTCSLMDKTYVTDGQVMFLLRKVSVQELEELWNSCYLENAFSVTLEAMGVQMVNSEIARITGWCLLSQEQIYELWYLALRNQALKSLLEYLDPEVIPLLGEREEIIEKQDRSLLEAIYNLLHTHEGV